MTSEREETVPLEPPFSGLERTLIDEFLRLRGYQSADLAALSQADRDALLKAASLHASARLAEIEARAHYVHEMHEGGKRD